MIELRPVNRDTVCIIGGLKVSPDQCDFVAPNFVTLAQGVYEGGAYPLGIWNGETPVGFLSVIDMRESARADEGNDRESAYLWRFMIAADHQGCGYGRAALARLFLWIRHRGLARVYVSCVPENGVGLKLYEGAGFQRTGRMPSGEIELRLPLTSHDD